MKVSSNLLSRKLDISRSCRSTTFFSSPFRVPGDLVLEFNEEGKATVRVFCDKKSIIYLGGSVLDWEKTLMFQGSQVRKNPQEATRCGCGHEAAHGHVIMMGAASGPKPRAGRP